MEIIINNCGSGGSLEELESLKNDPNFVFQNDPNFETLTLYDSEGNVINVNSWLECANYVNGGWSIENLNSYNGELIIYNYIRICGVFWIFKELIEQMLPNKLSKLGYIFIFLVFVFIPWTLNGGIFNEDVSLVSEESVPYFQINTCDYSINSIVRDNFFNDKIEICQMLTRQCSALEK